MPIKSSIITLIIIFWVFIGLIPFVLLIMFIPKKQFNEAKEYFSDLLFSRIKLFMEYV